MTPRPEPVGAAAGALDAAAAWVLLAHLAASAAFLKGYARLHVTLAGVPLFTGEAAIAALLLAEAGLLALTRRLPFPFATADRLLVAYGLIGAAFAGVGVSRGFGLAVFRDFALVYYAAFYFFARAFLGRRNDAARLAWALALGGTAGAAVHAVRFLAAPALSDGHGAPGSIALMAWLGAAGVAALPRPAAGLPGRLLRLLALATDAFVIYLSAHRTLLGVIVGSLALVALVARVRRDPHTRAVLRRLAALVAVAVAVVAVHARAMPELSPRFTDRGPVTLTDGFGGITSRWLFRLVRFDRDGRLDAAAAGQGPGRVEFGTGYRYGGGFAPSFIFRESAWRNAVARIRTSPWTGIGFGPDAALFPDYLCTLVSSPLSNCGNAHNTYLTLAMRMGIPVLLLFAAINTVIAVRFAAGLLRPPAAPRDAGIGLFLAVAYVSSLAYAGLNLFLESPYMSAPWWAVLGTMAGLPAAREAAGRD